MQRRAASPIYLIYLLDYFLLIAMQLGVLRLMTILKYYHEGTSKLFTSGPDILENAPSINNGEVTPTPQQLSLPDGRKNKLTENCPHEFIF